SIIESGSDMHISSGGNLTTTAEGDNTGFAEGLVKLTGSEIKATPEVDRAKWADYANESVLATSLGGAPIGKPAADPGEGRPAEVMEAEDIIDTLTSERLHPEYPGNGVLEHANSAGISLVSHDRMPSAQG